ncbi:unnamed protein product [Rotaria socialis]|uniref:F-box domain-containing protein n=1 Tax=Rotaria socialis TaxID=392032 RepID=A0A821PDE6_9BILA|nr:unnamed protein product [Rotaria socialis]
MNTLNNNDFNILDLPDEILLVILNKLNTTDVFHSLVDVNQQFDRLAFDYLYVRNIDMTDTMIINSLYDQISSIDTKILSKICEKVLPRIHHQVYKLTIEQYSMQHIILAANYPQHYSLSLINFQEEILYQYLTGILFYFLCFLLIKDDLIRRDLLTKQITHLKGVGLAQQNYYVHTHTQKFYVLIFIVNTLDGFHLSNVLLIINKFR